MNRIPNLEYANWILRIVILLQCVGVFFILQSGSAVEGMLFMDYGLVQGSAKQIEKGVGYLFLLLGVWVFFRPYQFILLILALMFLFLAWIIKQQGGSPFTEWTLFAHTVRILLPLSLLFLMNHGFTFKKTAYYLLAAGLSITFITHGLEAISLHPYFIDYLITSAAKLVELDLKESNAEIILKAIGSLDIIVGIFVLLYSNKWLLSWMALWGFITAFSRITELGWGMYPEVLVRAVHFGGPIALIFLKRFLETEKKLEGN